MTTPDRLEPWFAWLRDVPDHHDVYLGRRRFTAAGHGTPGPEVEQPRYRGRDDWAPGWYALGTVDQLASGVGSTLVVVADTSDAAVPVILCREDMEFSALDPGWPSLAAMLADASSADPRADEGGPDDQWEVRLLDVGAEPMWVRKVVSLGPIDLSDPSHVDTLGLGWPLEPTPCRLLVTHDRDAAHQLAELLTEAGATAEVERLADWDRIVTPYDQP